MFFRTALDRVKEARRMCNLIATGKEREKTQLDVVAVASAYAVPYSRAPRKRLLQYTSEVNLIPKTSVKQSTPFLDTESPHWVYVRIEVSGTRSPEKFLWVQSVMVSPFVFLIRLLHPQKVTDTRCKRSMYPPSSFSPV